MVRNIQVLYEDADVVVLNKPAGLLVHGIFDKHGPKHNEKTLVDWLVSRYPEVKTVGDKPEERAGIVHRLDRETSGVMVVARNQQAFEYLKKLFSAGGGSAFGGQSVGIKKEYIALVWGGIPEKKGVINKPISIRNGSVRRTVFKGKMTREAVTEYEVIGRYSYGKNELTLLRVSPKTGRTHQIRVHLSSIGHSVVGDKLYGKKGTLVFDDLPTGQAGGTELNRHFLHAELLELTLPSGKKKTFRAELPTELQHILKQLNEKF